MVMVRGNALRELVDLERGVVSREVYINQEIYEQELEQIFGWSYDTSGRLVGVPEFETAYYGELDKAAWGLPEARIANFHGGIWANWDPEAPSFEDYLMEARSWNDLCPKKKA